MPESGKKRQRNRHQTHAFPEAGAARSSLFGVLLHLFEQEHILKGTRYHLSPAIQHAQAVERIGALFHDPKPARYEKQIADLRNVIEGKDKDIKSLQREITTIQAGHDKEVADLKQEAQQVIKALMRVDELCPYVKGLLKWENYCKNIGLDKERTKALFTMQPYRYTGDLHSIRYNHTFRANDIVLQLKPDKDGPSGFRFTINGEDGDVWFKQQRKEFYERIGIDIERTEQRRGIKI